MPSRLARTDIIDPRGGSADALVVNLFGGPGSGKTTFAAQIFCDLKAAGIEAACPEEPAKSAIWSGAPWKLDEQVIMLGEVWAIQRRLAPHVDVIVCDSPVLLCSAYGRREPTSFHALARDLHRRMRHINVHVHRPETPYSTSGRRETAEQASAMDRTIAELLADIGEPVVDAPARQPARTQVRAAIVDRLRHTCAEREDT